MGKGLSNGRVPTCDHDFDLNFKFGVVRRPFEEHVDVPNHRERVRLDARGDLRSAGRRRIWHADDEGELCTPSTVRGDLPLRPTDVRKKRE